MNAPDHPAMKTGSRVYESIARVLFHDTPAPNQQIRIHVEHAEHSGGVRSWLRHSDTAAESARSHLEREIRASIVQVDIVDEAGLGVTASHLLQDDSSNNPAETAGEFA